jgi:hypothetical protein
VLAVAVDQPDLVVVDEGDLFRAPDGVVGIAEVGYSPRLAAFQVGDVEIATTSIRKVVDERAAVRREAGRVGDTRFRDELLRARVEVDGVEAVT